jgi:predicted PurR-regulated permease PerM
MEMWRNSPRHSRFLSALDRSLPLIVMLLAAALFAGLYFSRIIVFSSLIGIGLGVLLMPLFRLLHGKARIPRGICALAFAISLLGGVGGFSYLLLSMLSQQFIPVLERLPDVFATLRGRFFGILEGSEWLRSGFEQADIGALIGESLTRLLQSLQITTMAVGMLIYIVAIGVYLSVMPERYQESLLSVFPSRKRGKVRAVMHESASDFRRWFGAQLVSMFFVGTLAAATFWLIGVEQWLLIGSFAFILEFVPYIGPIMATVLAVLVTLTSQPELAPWALGAFIIIQQVEVNVITPVVMKKGVDLLPVHLLILAMVMGSWFGLLGVFVAAPFLTVARVIFSRTYGAAVESMGSDPEGPPDRQGEKEETAKRKGSAA